MAKRFTDTTKWSKSFFSDLDIKAKLVWLYLLDNCDNTGIYPINLKLMSFQIGFKVDLEILFSWFGSKIVAIESDKIFIKSFIDFQYGELNESNNAHKPVIKLLKKIGPIEDLKCSYLGAQDKEQDKDQDKIKDQDKEKAKNFEKEIEAIYLKQYPLKEGKSAGISKLLPQIKSEADLAKLIKAIEVYKNSIRDPRYTLHFSSFVNKPWTDYLDPNFGKLDVPAKQSHDVSHVWSEK